jgi:hypothetical protein
VVVAFVAARAVGIERLKNRTKPETQKAKAKKRVRGAGCRVKIFGVRIFLYPVPCPL